jgi:hypothetical protein
MPASNLRKCDLATVHVVDRSQEFCSEMNMTGRDLAQFQTQRSDEASNRERPEIAHDD